MSLGRDRQRAALSQWNRERALKTLAERLARHIRWTPECWIWEGRTVAGGYGQVAVRAGRRSPQLAAHRAAYLVFVGPIPDGFEVDHLCYVRLCCNPDHLEAVTKAENIRRSHARRKVLAAA